MLQLQKVSLTQLRQLRKSGGAIPRTGTFSTEKMYPTAAEKVSERCLAFKISTDAVDREGDVVRQEGWDFTHYLNNPVVLWGHDARRFSSLIGRCVDLSTAAGITRATVEFAPADVPVVGQMAEGVYQMCDKGFIHATSVGFRPLEWEFTDDKARGADDWWPGVDFLRQELLEFSICSIPANPEALIERPAAPAAPGQPMMSTEADARRAHERQRQMARLLATI